MVLLMWGSIRLMSVEDFGVLTVFLSVFNVFALFSGLGIANALLKFGSSILSINRHQVFSAQLFGFGLSWQVIISIIFIFGMWAVYHALPYAIYLSIFLGIRLFGFFIQLFTEAHLRSLHADYSFAKYKGITSLLLLTIGILALFFWGFLGYVIITAIFPFISIFWLKIRFKIRYLKFQIPKNILSFSLLTSGNAFISGLLYSLDIILLGFMCSEKDIAFYKVMIFIPYNILFLTTAIAQTDYARIARHERDASFLKVYLKKYFGFALPLALGLGSIGYVLLPEIIRWVFGTAYANATDTAHILWLGFVPAAISRVPLANLLSACGRVKDLLWLSVTGIIILAILGYILSKFWGIYGMAWSMSIALWLTSLGYVLRVIIYLKKIS